MLNLKAKLITLIVALWGFGANSAGAKSRQSDLCKVSLLKLHPLQMAVGMNEVATKQKRYQKLLSKPHKLKDKLKARPILLVRGPHGQLYIIDHHHTALAQWQAGLTETYAILMEDFSHLSDEVEFLKHMEWRGWARLKNAEGDQISYRALAELNSIKDLVHDPYRDLAAAVRDEGAFQKTDRPFMEFEWADFFRTRIHLDGSRSSFSKALRQAIKLAHSREAAHLPGYQPL